MSSNRNMPNVETHAGPSTLQLLGLGAVLYVAFAFIFGAHVLVHI